jgi:hypothetical protein
MPTRAGVLTMLYALQAIGQYDIEFCEQPMRTWYDDRLPELMKLSPVKIMADESVYNHHDARKQINSGSCNYINIKMAKCGGILEAKKIHDLAAEKGIACMMGGMLESRIALSAKLHFVYASPNIHFYDMDTCMLGHLQDPCVGGVTYDGYKLNISDAPGIGADADGGRLFGRMRKVYYCLGKRCAGLQSLIVFFHIKLIQVRRAMYKKGARANVAFFVQLFIRPKNTNFLGKLRISSFLSSIVS